LLQANAAVLVKKFCQMAIIFSKGEGNVFGEGVE
jgi:hypothetical protein